MYKLIFTLAIIILIGLGYYMYTQGYFEPKKESIQVTLNRDVINTEIARSMQSRILGLSGRESLPVSTGLLFIFPETLYPSIWMKDMKFSIDIIFISSEGTVNEFFENVSPDTYLEKPPRQFKTLAASRYVLEVPAGTVADAKLRAGMTISELVDFK